jgi:hypothetical protein
MTGAEVIINKRSIALLDQLLYHMGADVTGSPCY